MGLLLRSGSPLLLRARSSLLRLQPAFIATSGRSRRDAISLLHETVGDAITHPFDREVAISKLRTLVGGDDAQCRSISRQKFLPLPGSKRWTQLDRKDALDARIRGVRMLSARAATSAEAPLEFVKWDSQ